MGLLEDGMIAYSHIGIPRKDVDILFEMAMDEDFNQFFYDEEDEENEESLILFAPCHALMILAEIEAAHQFSEQFINYFDHVEEDDDYYIDALAYFFAGHWSHNIERFRTLLEPTNNNLRKKTFILEEVFEKIIKYFWVDDDVSQIEEIIVDFLKQDKNSDGDLNASAMARLIEIDGLKYTPKDQSQSLLGRLFSFWK